MTAEAIRQDAVLPVARATDLHDAVTLLKSLLPPADILVRFGGGTLAVRVLGRITDCQGRLANDPTNLCSYAALVCFLVTLPVWPQKTIQGPD